MRTPYTMLVVTGVIASALLAGAMPSMAAAPQPSALPAVGPGMPCADGKTSRECDIRTMISVRGYALHVMWMTARFDQLDGALLSLSRGTARLPDGQPELLVFEAAFGALFSDPQKWETNLAKLAEWRAESPNSPALAIVEIMFWKAYAWHGRGNGYASKVPPEAWQLFRERMDKAKARLQENNALAATSPLWHSLNIATLIHSGAPRAAVAAAYGDAVLAFPGSQQIHFAMSEAMQRKWGAADGDFDRFARNAIHFTQKTEGPAIYARLYWSEDCNCDDALTFGRPGDPDWKLMKQGFEELLKRYPDELYNRNKFASFACRANDRTTYVKLRRELGGNIVDALWPSSWKVDVCDRRMTQKT